MAVWATSPARHLDMHPADLVAGLDTVLHHRRLHNRPEPADTDAAILMDHEGSVPPAGC